MTPPPRRPRRQGFTLVELLVVILILAILVALLVPAIAAAVRAANDARVTAEINNLSTALADFKSRFGEFPPSRIALYNNCYYNTSDSTAMSPSGDVSLGDINQRTIRAMKRYFPRAGALFSTTAYGAGGPVIDWDGPNFSAGGVILQGHECLVFFLGGMPDQAAGSTAASYSVTGFAKDPTNPFQRVAATTNRTPPMFEFPASRLQDVYNVTAGSSGLVVAAPPNGFPSFLDPLSSASAPRPYAYFSAYGNNGYDPNDDDSMGFGDVPAGASSPASGSIEFDDTVPGTIVGSSFYVSFPVNHASGKSNIAGSAAPNPYTSGVPDTSVLSPQPPQKLSWLNPQSFQLMSAGRDGLWGRGGAYDATSTTGRLPLFGTEASNTNLIPLRARERDNLTNFAGGRLE